MEPGIEKDLPAESKWYAKLSSFYVKNVEWQEKIFHDMLQPD